ncbi:MBL fold metallo-hydrolase [Hankyongella ginsenosidimutans]|uniref:MBL fold metallo-hydrolase n=1 Tax=Hankyongella ginsenosidimutans TaxID=1763828 RepID=A0A4D7BZX0_9SPHN|nr:MBL fold metallo-hydrolase [Hankyongella ginsenosidimutans]QCI78994.1 MBL fold metallo-hydrolase [Hankyongella ginsenosidimutans]
MSSLTVRCWGARGTFPSPGIRFSRYGGDTMCFEVLAGDRRLILDAGTGIKALGDAMDGRETHILLSHGHIDHVVGLTQFAPFWQAGRPIVLWVPEGPPGAAAHLLLEPPLFPVALAEMPASIRVVQYAPDAPCLSQVAFACALFRSIIRVVPTGSG